MAASTRKRDSKHAHREIFEIIKSKTKDIIQSRKNSNLIIDIFSYLEVFKFIGQYRTHFFARKTRIYFQYQITIYLMFYSDVVTH